MTSRGQDAFTGLAAGYDRHRPVYPNGFYSHLREAVDRAFLGRVPGQVLDVAAGTGIATLPLARRFPERPVIGIEPNDDMRGVAEGKAGGSANLAFVRGSAEALGEAAASTDLIFVGQALHWFDRPRAYGEIGRVLRPGGILAVAYNNRAPEASPFLEDYLDFLEASVPGYNRDYRGFDIPGELEALNWSGPVERLTESWVRHMPLEGFMALAHSVSYVKDAVAAKGSAQIIDPIRDLARHHFPDGKVQLPYESDLVMVAKG